MSEDYINYSYKMPAAKTKQTAVEWFANELKSLDLAHENGYINVDGYDNYQVYKSHLLEQAKQMEKGQIEDAHIEGQRVFDKYPHTEWTNNQAEIYYEQTYAK